MDRELPSALETPFNITLLPLIFNKVFMIVNGHMFILNKKTFRTQDQAEVFNWVCCRECGAHFQTTVVNGQHKKDEHFLDPVVHTHTENWFENGVVFRNLMTNDSGSGSTGIEEEHGNDDDVNVDIENLSISSDSDEWIHIFNTREQPIAMDGLYSRNPSMFANASSFRAINPFISQKFPYLPAEFEKTLTGQQFYIEDIGTNRNRIIILSTIENMEYLSESSFWLTSGAYNSSSLGRYKTNIIQVYTIHGDINIGSSQLCVPLVFALFLYPTEDTYRTMFMRLNQFALRHRIDFSRNTGLQIVSDLNVYAFNALKAVFPFAKHTVSFYHFSQNIYNQLEFGDMMIKYINERHFNLISRQMPALAYLPASKIIEGWDKIKEMFKNNCTGWEHFAIYFELSFIFTKLTQTINGQEAHVRLPPLFDPQSWSISTSVDAEHIRSVVAEAWNQRLDKLIYKQSGTCNIISQLHHVQTETEHIIEQASKGSVTISYPSDARLDDIKKKIQELEANENCDILEFLKSVSYNINFKGDYSRNKFNML